MAPSIPADDAAHVLIVEDDRRIRDLLSRLLQDHGYRATTAGNALEARACLKSLAFDLIVLDVMMPGEDGVQFAVSMRRDSTVPILMLTARAETVDRVRGLEAGADDYLAKPFEPRELLLRIASILRRIAQPPAPQRAASVRFGAFTFLPERGELREQDQIVRLSDREKEMLRLLAASAGEIVSREALAGSGNSANERTVDVQVNRLRRKIERDPANPIHLQTARGAGYRLLVDT
ncbi:MAG: response regulator transcription factor [Methylobacteriaceae bacterium]|nr:response regulator transcription factor [Methylobacteriaceae bacterium]MBV9222277.1 response regulator transcription factor [Methylobacteriaceae bacterium]